MDHHRSPQQPGAGAPLMRREDVAERLRQQAIGVKLAAGQRVRLRIDFYQDAYGRKLRLAWRTPGELIEKIRHYQAHPDEALRIRLAGQAELIRATGGVNAGDSFTAIYTATGTFPVPVTASTDNSTASCEAVIQ